MKQIYQLGEQTVYLKHNIELHSIGMYDNFERLRQLLNKDLISLKITSCLEIGILSVVKV